MTSVASTSSTISYLTMKESLAIQKALMENMPKRFISWLKDKNIEKVSGVTDDVIKDFVEFNDKEVTLIGSKATISFGKKYKGKSYFDVWMSGRKGRSYLLWCLEQEWFYDDNREIVKSLAEKYIFPDVPMNVDYYPLTGDGDANEDEKEETLPERPPSLERQKAFTAEEQEEDEVKEESNRKRKTPANEKDNSNAKVKANIKQRRRRK